MFRPRSLLAAALALCALALFGAPAADAQSAPISRYARWSGHYDYAVTGGSLRNSASNTCSVTSTSSRSLTLPASAVVRAAYLYWGGSGPTVDANVTLNSAAIAASRTFTETFQTFAFFGGFADVTSRVTGSATFTFGNLTVATGGAYCSSSAVQAGWALIVIYERAIEPLRAINVFDGLEAFYGGALNLAPDGFRIRPSGNDGKMTVVTWEGDPGNSGANGGFTESLRFNGTILDDGLVPSGSNPALQQFDGTINSAGVTNSYGVDIDTYTLTPLLVPGATSATTTYSSGLDLVLLTAQVVSVTSDPFVDLSITKSHNGDFSAGQPGNFVLAVANAPGMEREDNVITVTDTLPAGLSYVNGTGSGWTCNVAGQTVTCTRPPPLAAGAAAPALTISVLPSTLAAPGVTNVAAVSSASFDANATNNSASDSVTVRAPRIAATKISELLTDPYNGAANPRHIPGALVRYTLQFENSGTLGTDSNSVIVTDTLPTELVLHVAGPAPGGIEFIDGVPSSGLALVNAAQVSYTNRLNGAAPYDYVPQPDVNGFDPAITGVRVALTGSMSPAGNAGSPFFQLRLRARIR